MDELQVIFLISWVVFFLLSCIALIQAKNIKGFLKGTLFVVTMLAPIVGSLIALFVLFAEKALFWQNSATKDSVWIAETDINNVSSGDGD